MKKKIAYILLAVLCLAAVAGLVFGLTRKNADTGEADPVINLEEEISEKDALKKAEEYLRTIYKDAAKETPRDFERIGIVPVGKFKFEVTWSVDVDEKYVKIVVNENGMVTIDVNEECGEEIPYVLTATIKDSEGNTKTLTWEHMIPKKIVASYQEIVDMAYALKPGESLENEATLKGIISKINTAWSDTYKNITVTIIVEGRETKPIQCYRLTGENAKDLAVGDTITVTGKLKNYNGTIEFDAGCVLDGVQKGDGKAPEVPTIKGTMQEIVDKAYALEKDTVLEGGEAILTGSVTKINTKYDANYKNVTVTIVVEGREDKPIMCYRMKGTNAENVAAGDLITVRGTLKNYNGTVEFDAGCELTNWVKGGGTVKPDVVTPLVPTAPEGGLKAGDKVVIYAPAYALALSTKKTGNYNVGVSIKMVNGVLTGYQASEVFTVVKNLDGTYSFDNGGKLSMGSSYSSMTLNEVNDKWEVIDLGKGLYNIKNVGRGNYIEWYNSYSNWSTYNSNKAATDDQFQLAFYVVSREQAPTEKMTLEDAKAALEEMYKNELTVTNEDFYRVGVLDDGTNKFTVKWSVIVDSVTVTEQTDGSYLIEVPENPTEDVNYTLTATIYDEKNQSITVSWDYKVEKVEAEPPIKDGDQVVIYAPAYNKAFSTLPVSEGSYYQKGQDITVTDGVVEGYTDAEVWTVIANADGTYSFANGGKNIGMAASYSSMSLGAVNDDWKLVDLGNGLYNLQNAVRGNYMQWSTKYSNWSTYNPNNAATDDQYQLSFYVIPQSPIKDGDQVVIYAPAYNKAFSTLPVSAGSYYQKGQDITVTDGVVTGYTDAEVWTVIANADGTYSFANGGKNIGMAASYSSMSLGAVNDDWTLVDLGNGVYNLQNAVRGNYMQWSTKYSNWSTYNPDNAATDNQYHISFYVIPKPAIKGGDQVVIYAPAYNKAFSTLPVSEGSYYQKGQDITVTDGVVEGYTDAEVWTVIANADGTYSFANGGKNIGMAASYSSMSLGAVNDDWKLVDLGNGLYNLQNAVRGNYMQWSTKYSNWSTYNPNNAATDDQYQLSFYVIPQPPIKDGDQVVIYASAYNKAFSTLPVSAGSYYQKGQDITVTDGVVTGYTDAEVWTVIANADGTYSFANGGKNIGMAASYSSMSLGAVNDDWTLVDLGNGVYNLQNAVRGNYMQWSTRYSNWSTYNPSNAATDNQYHVSFYKVPVTE